MEPPIPYIGSKKLWVKELAAIAEKLPQNARVLDAFGGSGLCAHVFKNTRPDLDVTTNDADGYITKILPHADAFRRWFDENKNVETWGDRERNSLSAALQNSNIAKRIFDDILRVNAIKSGSVDRKPHRANHRLTLGNPPEDYLKGVKVINMMWTPANPIPATDYDFLILDPPYNPYNRDDAQRYQTNLKDPNISTWTAQEAFKSKTPAICWGREGWLVDYEHAHKIAQKMASRGHTVEWCAINPAAVKLGINSFIFK